jgi:hypothetical protein
VEGLEAIFDDLGLEELLNDLQDLSAPPFEPFAGDGIDLPDPFVADAPVEGNAPPSS